MENLKGLYEKRNELYAEAQALVEKAKTEKRALSDDEVKEFESKEAEIKNIDATIATEEKLRNLKLDDANNKKQEEKKETDEERDIREFAGYIRSVASGIEERAGTNLVKSDNGAVIPKTIANKIIDKVVELSPIYAKATKYDVKGTLEIPTVDEGADSITVSYASEFSDLTSHSNKFGTIELTGYLYGALTKISKSLLNNSDFKLTNWVVSKMGQKIAKFIENELLNGTAGKISGIARSYDSNKMKKQLAKKSSITADELIDLQELVPDAFQADAIWIMRKATRTSIRKLKDGQGNYLLNRDLSAKWGYTLLGKDVYVSENAQELGTAGNLPIIYGDISGLAVKESEKQEIQILRELFAAQHAIGVVAWGEVDAKVENTQKIACAECGEAD